jgi:HAMP domain-containing protein
METVLTVLGLIALIIVADEAYARWRLRRTIRLLESGKWKLRD